MPVAWTINDSAPAALGLARPQLTYANLSPDTLTIDQPGATWDADPIWAYGDTLTLKRDGVTVFVGKVRTWPRFAGAQAESISYTIAGPWDWLQRRALLQNQAVVIDPEVSTTPTYIPQGLILLNQADGGTSVTVAQGLETIIDAAIDAGVPILKGDITGFDYQIPWDQIADLTIADGITRLLSTAPDAVVWWDYTTTTSGSPTPTIHIGRRANLVSTSLAIAPAGTAAAAFGAGGYAEFEAVRLTSRPDLQVPGVHIKYRRTDVVNGQTYLKIVTQGAGLGAETDENALVRTVELAGSEFSESVLSQECVAEFIPAALKDGEELTDADAEMAASKRFFARVHGWLSDDDVIVKKLTPEFNFKKAWEPDEDTGEMVEVSPDNALPNALVTGGITPWMRDSTLNRRGQEQEIFYTVEAIGTINGQTYTEASPYKAAISRGYLATNVTTRVYSWQESADYKEPEPTPTGLAAAIYAAMSELQYEGALTLVQVECDLQLRVGRVANLTGGRAEWTTMGALVQGVTADLDAGRTEITLGWPRQITPDELMSIYRAGRLKQPALRGLIRNTGRF